MSNNDEVAKKLGSDFIAYAGKEPQKALMMMAGFFVGLLEILAKKNGNDPAKKMIISEGYRDIVILPPGEPAEIQEGELGSKIRILRSVLIEHIVGTDNPDELRRLLEFIPKQAGENDNKGAAIAAVKALLATMPGTVPAPAAIPQHNGNAAWLIERTEGGITWYLAVKNKLPRIKTFAYPHWTTDVWDAIRLKRRDDAEYVWGYLKHHVGQGGHGTSEVMFTEHIFEDQPSDSQEKTA